MGGSKLGPPYPLTNPTPRKLTDAAVEIAARHRLEPLRQGGLDGLCALYGAINLIRLALADLQPLGRARCVELFGAGIKFLNKKMELDEAIVWGVGTRRRTALVRHLARAVSTSNCQLEIQRPNHESWSSIADEFGWIEGSIAQGMPVLVTLTGGLEHHTVVSGVTPTTLQLFDSGGHRFLRKTSCGLKDGYHRIPPKGLLRIAVYRSG